MLHCWNLQLVLMLADSTLLTFTICSILLPVNIANLMQFLQMFHLRVQHVQTITSSVNTCNWTILPSFSSCSIFLQWMFKLFTFLPTWPSCSIFQQCMFKLFHTLAPLGKLLVILTNIFRLFYILICLYKLFLPVVGLPLIFGLILCRYPKPSVTAIHTVFLPHIQKCKKNEVCVHTMNGNKVKS